MNITDLSLNDTKVLLWVDEASNVYVMYIMDLLSKKVSTREYLGPLLLPYRFVTSFKEVNTKLLEKSSNKKIIKGKNLRCTAY